MVAASTKRQTNRQKGCFFRPSMATNPTKVDRWQAVVARSQLETLVLFPTALFFPLHVLPLPLLGKEAR